MIPAAVITTAPALRPKRILVIEDNPAEARLAREWLREKGAFDIQVVTSLVDALNLISTQPPFDAITIDLMLPDSTGLATYRAVHAAAPDTPAVVVSGLADEEAALDAMCNGAQDYLVKNDALAEALPRAVRYAIERQALLVESKRLEHKLQQAQRLEALGTLAGGVAHDFNNLLTAIIGYYELLRERVANDPQASADLEEIGKAAKTAATVTQHLLTFARAEPLQKLVIDINGLIREFRRTLMSVLGDRVSVHLALAEESLTVEADPGELHQLLLNLAANAADAMPVGGVFAIETRAAVDPSDDGRRIVRLLISDTGRGMDDATRGRMFEPFFTTKDFGGRGTGLGLASVHGIVTHSGGTIAVRSAPGAGTSFVIDLPLRRAAATVSHPTPDASAAAGQALVLVIEDDRAVRLLMTNTLVRANFDVIAAASGAEALALMETETRDLSVIISNVVLPDSRATAIIPALRKRWPNARVVLTSGCSDEPLHRLDVDGFLPKPFTPEAVTTIVRRVLDGAA
jgi:signal transduction histidine kinase